jgi:capsular exopolysaccharide synthesis family protein
LVTVKEPNSVAAEAYRGLRTNLLYAFVDHPPRVIMFTSPGQGEGKSTTCANLGVVLAQAGKSTAIVDCDFRKPVIHKFFGLSNVRGVMNVLIEDCSYKEVSKEPEEGLTVLTVGPIPPQPAEVLSTQGFATFLGEMRRDFEYVLVDAPPIGLVSDPAILATQGDGVLLVLDAQNTRKGAVRSAMRSLRTVGANVIGTVMNNTIAKDSYYYYASYEYRGE